LGDFSPVGRLFELGSFFENIQKYIAQCFGLLSFRGKSYVFIACDKKWVGLRFQSAHPVALPFSPVFVENLSRKTTTTTATAATTATTTTTATTATTTASTTTATATSPPPPPTTTTATATTTTTTDARQRR
jgi:hypothetical protein